VHTTCSPIQSIVGTGDNGDRLISSLVTRTTVESSWIPIMITPSPTILHPTSGVLSARSPDEFSAKLHREPEHAHFSRVSDEGFQAPPHFPSPPRFSFHFEPQGEFHSSSALLASSRRIHKSEFPGCSLRNSATFGLILFRSFPRASPSRSFLSSARLLLRASSPPPH
jgi:hypothetical protein